MNDYIEQAKELAKSEDAVRGLVVGGRVYDPLLFAPEVVNFSAKQYIFLRHYRLGVPLETAAHKADLSAEAAERFLEKPMTRAWLQDRAAKDHIKNEWAEPAKWWAMGNEVLDGKKMLNKAQTEVWKEFGKRVSPLSDHGPVGTRIEINIDGDALQRSKERRKSIEAQIVQDDHAA